MRRKILVPIIIGFFIISAFAGIVRASSCSPGYSKNRGNAGEIVNATCPVMGEKVERNTPYSTEYKGKRIGFCCSGCVNTFESDPEKYLDKIETD